MIKEYICLKCDGVGNIKREVQHSFLTFIFSSTFTTKICPVCKGRGIVKTISRSQQIREAQK